MVGGRLPSLGRLAKRSHSYAASIVETIRQPLVVLDAGLRVLSANRAFSQTFHVAPQESEGKLLYELGERQWDIPQLRELLERILPQRSEVRDYEVDHVFASIGRRTMLLNARRLLLRPNRPPLILLALEDITERRRVEETRQILLAATSHDVLNALGNIIGCAEMLEGGDHSDEWTQGIISVSKALTEVMRDLQVHAHADDDRPNLALVSARALLRDSAAAAVWRCRKKGLLFAVDLPTEGNITTDPGKVTRILDNLLSNAVRYTPSGSIHLQGQLASTDLSVTVRDTGIGIPAEDLDRVFEGYYRAPTARRIEPLGSGLGLFTVKRFSKLLGGTTRIESTPGVGTTCTVVLPRQPPAG